jgi:hypothetical protein
MAGHPWATFWAAVFFSVLATVVESTSYQHTGAQAGTHYGFEPRPHTANIDAGCSRESFF